MRYLYCLIIFGYIAQILSNETLAFPTYCLKNIGTSTEFPKTKLCTTLVNTIKSQPNDLNAIKNTALKIDKLRKDQLTRKESVNANTGWKSLHRYCNPTKTDFNLAKIKKSEIFVDDFTPEKEHKGSDMHSADQNSTKGSEQSLQQVKAMQKQEEGGEMITKLFVKIDEDISEDSKGNTKQTEEGDKKTNYYGTFYMTGNDINSKNEQSKTKQVDKHPCPKLDAQVSLETNDESSSYSKKTSTKRTGMVATDSSLDADKRLLLEKGKTAYTSVSWNTSFDNVSMESKTKESVGFFTYLFSNFSKRKDNQEIKAQCKQEQKHRADNKNHMTKLLNNFRSVNTKNDRKRESIKTNTSETQNKSFANFNIGYIFKKAKLQVLKLVMLSEDYIGRRKVQKTVDVKYNEWHLAMRNKGISPTKRRYKQLISSYVNYVYYFQMMFCCKSKNKSHDRNYPKAKLWFSKMPEFFSFYWQLLRHDFINAFLTDRYNNNHPSPMYTKYTQLFDALKSVKIQEGCDTDTDIYNAKVLLQNLYKENLFPSEETIGKESQSEIVLKKYKESASIFNDMCESTLFIPFSSLTPFSCGFVDFEEVEKIYRFFQETVCIDRETFVKDFMAENIPNEIRKSAQTILLTLNGTFLPDHFKLHKSKIAKIVAESPITEMVFSTANRVAQASTSIFNTGVKAQYAKIIDYFRGGNTGLIEKDNIENDADSILLGHKQEEANNKDDTSPVLYAGTLKSNSSDNILKRTGSSGQIKISTWSINRDKVLRQVNLFCKNIDTWLDDLALLGIIKKQNFRFECLCLYNVDGISTENFGKCIQQVNTLNLKIICFLLRVINEKSLHQ